MLPLPFIAVLFILAVGLLAKLINRSQPLSFADRLGGLFLDLGELVVGQDGPSVLELRQSGAELGSRLGELRSIPRETRTDEQNAEMRAVANELVSLDAEASAVEHLTRSYLEQTAWDAAVKALTEGTDDRGESRGPRGANGNFSDADVRTVAGLISEHEDYRKWADNVRNGINDKQMPPIFIEGRTLLGGERRDLLSEGVGADGFGTGAGVFLDRGTPMAPTPRQQRFWLRDVIPVGTTGLAAVPYVRELNPATTETGASFTPEGTTKAQATMTFVDEMAIAIKITAWVPATTELLADAPTLRSYINGRLVYMLQVRETQQLIVGAGGASQIEGIQTVSGTQPQAAVNNDPFATFAAAAGLVENVDGEANGIALNPLDYWTAVAIRHSTSFDGSAQGGSAASPFAGPTGTIWGLPAIRTRALTTLSAIVADWTGAMILDRLGITIATSDSHGEYFVENKVAIRAEQRTAFPIWRPDLFVLTTIDITA